MKYRIKKGTSAMLHYAGDGFDLRGEFVTKETEKDVTFTEDDIWFKPTNFLDPKQSDQRIAFMLNGRPLGRDSYNNLMANYYGFRIPKNKLNIDLILVKKDYVSVFEEAPREIMVKPTDDSSVESDRHLRRRLNRESGDYHFPGHFTK